MDAIIFAVETEEQTLQVFKNEAEAVSYCEGLDVEAPIWLFWNSAGEPLIPEFITANQRGLFLVRSGTYRLIKDDSSHHAELLEALEHIVTVDGPPPLNTIDGIRKHLT